MLRPNNLKYRKYQKKRIANNVESKSNKLHFGNFGIQSLEKGRITARQIESVRRTIANSMKRKGKIWIRIFPDIPITQKPAEVRMGKGKGNVNFWIAVVKPGKILYEVSGLNSQIIKKALEIAITKLNVKARIIERQI